MSVTPQEEMLARKASLLVRASRWGWDDESRTRRWPRASLTARPIMPLLDDRIVSILSLLMAGSSRAWTFRWFRVPARDAHRRLASPSP